MEEETIEMATFLYSPQMIQEAIAVAVRIVNGETVPETTVIPASRVDRIQCGGFFRGRCAVLTRSRGSGE